MVETTLFSQKIKQAFSQSATSYNENASFQQEAATHLSTYLEDAKLSPKTVLEIGAGTGLCSQVLATIYPAASLWITDTSLAMLKQNQCAAVKWVMNGEAPSFKNSVDLAVSGLAFQWFQDTQTSIDRLLQKTKRLIFTVPLLGTFEEWKQWCITHQHPESLLPFFPPDTWLGAHRGTFKEMDLVQTFSSPRDFVRSLKGLGAHTSPAPSQRGLFALRHHHDPLKVTFKMGIFDLEGYL